ncbi:hypothetical protein K402DRAFT_197695 [Aulographum hederae CBS 113979]|uniref:Uncharacterized protein n=1 Tax=Aulographum hederae CBS 113979 TaxID=1176131 RepID=A0A6G1GN28_9PEZI|nr:hypothetical protein K402DRAFT_197695 [Aulographum hederae CBS 113979]
MRELEWNAEVPTRRHGTLTSPYLITLRRSDIRYVTETTAITGMAGSTADANDTPGPQCTPTTPSSAAILTAPSQLLSVPCPVRAPGLFRSLRDVASISFKDMAGNNKITRDGSPWIWMIVAGSGKWDEEGLRWVIR